MAKQDTLAVCEPRIIPAGDVATNLYQALWEQRISPTLGRMVMMIHGHDSNGDGVKDTNGVGLMMASTLDELKPPLDNGNKWVGPGNL